MLLRLLLCSTLAAAIAVVHGGSSSSRSEYAAAIDTTPFGPYTFSGALNATQTSGFVHFLLPGAASDEDNSFTLTPSLAGSGASFTLTAANPGTCQYALCVTKLLRAAENTAEWTAAIPSLGRSDTCELYYNSTADATMPIKARITPGLTHFTVYAQNKQQQVSSSNKRRSGRSWLSGGYGAAAGSTSDCAFTLEVSGDACAPGLFGPTCAEVNATSFSSAPLTGLLSADPADSTLYFAVHPDNIYASSIRVNVSSSSDNFTVFLHEGDVPSLSSPLNPRADFNVSSHYAVGTKPIDYETQAQLTIPFPSYRVDSAYQARRYFLGVTREGAAVANPKDSSLSVLVDQERVCPTGYHGASCEFWVSYILDPFDLASANMELVPSSSFAWTTSHKEIWYYFALLFLNVNPDRNFSIGVISTEGQLVPPLYLRMGQVPTLTQYDAKLTVIDPANTVRFFRSGPTLLHDAVWYVGINVPIDYPSMGNVGLFINTDCPGTTSKRSSDGSSITVTECNGHGTCQRDTHQCLCSDRWNGWDCMSVDQTMGLSAGIRALIIIMCILGTVGFGYALCWWFSTGMNRRRVMANAGYGHHLDEDGAGGRGGGAGGRPPGAAGGINRPPMGRI